LHDFIYEDGITGFECGMTALIDTPDPLVVMVSPELQKKLLFPEQIDFYKEVEWIDLLLTLGKCMLSGFRRV
jgi:hypothetical protein